MKKNYIIIILCMLGIIFTIASPLYALAITQDDKTGIAKIVSEVIKKEGIEAALRHYDKLYKFSKEDYNFAESEFFQLAQKLVSQKNTDAADLVLLKNCETYPGSSKSYSLLGMIHLDKNTAKAKSYFEKAVSIDPSDFSSSYQLSCIYVYQNYDKKTFEVKMRDGIKLLTQVYTPKDTVTSYPILYCRSPYSSFAYGEGVSSYFGLLGPGPEFIKEKFIFVVQDVRGRFLSEGDFVVMRPNLADHSDPSQTDESTDAYDSIDWMVKNIQNHNGNVGIWGGSYLAYYGALALVNAHPSIKAVSLESPVAEVFIGDDYHHNGALHLAYSVVWLNGNGQKRTSSPSSLGLARLYDAKFDDMYSHFLNLGPLGNIDKKLFKGQSPFWTGMMEHETRDSFWSDRALGQYLKGINGPAVVVSGSWFDDQDLYGALDTYTALKENNPDLPLWFFMGCWDHDPWWMQEKGKWGEAKLPAGKIGDHYRDEYLVNFFNKFLKGKGEFNPPGIQVFESGSNQLVKYDNWPPENSVPHKLYFGSSGTLIKATTNENEKSCDVFVSDPANPVPFYQGKQANWSADFIHADQTFASKRNDVLVYQGASLKKDFTAAGPVEVELYVSTTSTDADWVVKIIDEYPISEDHPEGFQMLVRGDIMRGKFRNSFSRPEPFAPGEVTRVKFSLPAISHTFRKDHRIMIQAQSSWFPLFDRNPQTFVNIPKAKEEDFVKATHRLYRSSKYPSNIIFYQSIKTGKLP